MLLAGPLTWWFCLVINISLKKICQNIYLELSVVAGLQNVHSPAFKVKVNSTKLLNDYINISQPEKSLGKV